MKFKIITLICLLALSLGASSARAEDGNIRARAGVNVEGKLETRLSQREAKAEVRREIKELKTDLFKRIAGERKEVRNRMHRNDFQTRKDFLVRKLRLTLDNLKNIRDRLSERITTAEANGRNMTEAEAALVVADEKWAKAKVAVDVLAAFSYPTASSTASTTAEVELERPRKIGDEAIKAVKEARDALKAVVRAIAHNMGLKIGVTATTTATTTPR
ncbi:MAG TPA: hypothetical protein VJI66_03110 [Candidatus Paceibacterota bacterium]